MHRLSKLSLANRSVVALITAIIAIFGFVSLGSLKQELIPSIETPQAAIVTTYIGASPEVIDKQVSQPIETAVRALDGLVTSSSTSQSNVSIVRVEFEYGTSTAKVKESLNTALASLTLPAEAKAKAREAEDAAKRAEDEKARGEDRQRQHAQHGSQGRRQDRQLELPARRRQVAR